MVDIWGVQRENATSKTRRYLPMRNTSFYREMDMINVAPHLTRRTPEIVEFWLQCIHSEALL